MNPYNSDDNESPDAFLDAFCNQDKSSLSGNSGPAY